MNKTVKVVNKVMEPEFMNVPSLCYCRFTNWHTGYYLDKV